FDNSDVTVENGTLGALTTSDNITWTAVFTPTAGIEVTTNVVTVAATFTDTAGNAGTGLASANYAIDTAAPGVPPTPDLADGSDSGSSSTDNITSATTPTFSGTAEANSTVTLFDGTTQIGSAIANGSGDWSATTSTLTDATHSITATATDI